MTQSFEKFEVYQKGVELAKLIFKLMENNSFEKEFGFKNQIKRAVISITNNIAEGSEYNNNKQFIRYLKNVNSKAGLEIGGLSFCSFKALSNQV